MKHKKRSSREKFEIVLEGLKNQEKVADLCNRHGIAQSQYYKWRDQFLQNGIKAFELNPDKKVEQLESKVKSLTNLVGQLTVELKKTERELEWLES
jgi:transposase-like protein